MAVGGTAVGHRATSGYSARRVKISRPAQWASALVVSLALTVPTTALAEPAESDADATEPEPEPEPAEPGVDDTAAAPETTDAEPSDDADDPAQPPVDDTATDGSEPEPARQPVEPEPEPPVEPEPEPVVTIKATPIDDTSRRSKRIPPDEPMESAADGRRTHRDQRILLHAAALSFGVAGAAGITTAVAVQRAVSADRELGRLDAGQDDPALRRRESNMTTLAYAAGIVAGVQLVTGAVLLGVGLRKSSPRRQALAPTVGRGHVGLTWRTRF